jgi:hypothetical protein
VDGYKKMRVKRVKTLDRFIALIKAKTKTLHSASCSSVFPI